MAEKVNPDKNRRFLIGGAAAGAAAVAALAATDALAQPISYGGYVFPGLLFTTQTGSYTFAMTDQGTVVQYNATGAGTFTIPLNSSVAFPTGILISFRQIGAGQLTIAGAGGVTLNTATSFTTRTQWSRGSIHKINTDTWVIDGDLT